MSKEAKKKNVKKVVPVSSTRSGLVGFFCQGNFLTKHIFLKLFTMIVV